MSADKGPLLAPYATPEDAARAKTRLLWVLGVAGLAYFGAVLSMIFSEPSGSGVAGGAGPGGTALAATGPLLALLVSAAERRKLEAAAGRKLYNFEVAAIANATAAGQLVGDAELISGQEYLARRHMSVATAVSMGSFLTVAVVAPLLAFLALGLLSPVVFAVATSIVAVSALYAAWAMARRAVGAAAVNILFDAPMSAEEDELLGDDSDEGQGASGA